MDQDGEQKSRKNNGIITYGEQNNNQSNDNVKGGGRTWHGFITFLYS
jgi:hypothetical protein